MRSHGLVGQLRRGWLPGESAEALGPVAGPDGGDPARRVEVEGAVVEGIGGGRAGEGLFGEPTEGIRRG